MKPYAISQAHLQTNAVAVGDKIYFFDVYYTSREHLPSIGPLDVKVFETGTIKYCSEFKIGIVYH